MADVRPRGHGFGAEHVEGGEPAEKLPLWSVVGEGHVIAVVADMLGADDFARAVGELEIKGCEEGVGGGG